MLDIAIVEGVRTPFAKVLTALADVPAQDLGVRVTQALLERSSVKPDDIDQVIFGNVGSPVDAVIDTNVRDETANILKTLSPKEEKVIRLRFGIGCEREHTLEEIGQEFDVTRERIRQIEAKALRQLRSPERARHLRALLAAR